MQIKKTAFALFFGTRGFFPASLIAGARQDLPPELENFVRKVRQKAKQPLCVGFGVSTPEQARRIAAIADGVIIGSRIIQLLEEDRSLKALKTFAAGVRKALG